MNKEDIVNKISHEKIVAIIRLQDVSKIGDIVQSLVSAGIKTIEITSNTPGFLTEIKKAKKLFPKTLIGAGTITNSIVGKKAIDAGAQFLVTPNCDIKIIELAHKNNIPVLMGALTPTEINIAVEAGADFIKLFPAGVLGLNYFKAIKAPFDKVKFIPVGGIEIKDTEQWISAGAVAVGLGNSLIRPLGEKENTEFIEATLKKINKL